jgi:hypothetical protein
MKLAALLLALCLQIPAVRALAHEAARAEDVPARDCQEAVTVFQDVSRVGRKDRAASNISRRHDEMARQGWRFVGLESYIENGDLEGFYLSYVRPAVCPATADTD